MANQLATHWRQLGYSKELVVNTQLSRSLKNGLNEVCFRWREEFKSADLDRASCGTVPRESFLLGRHGSKLRVIDAIPQLLDYLLNCWSRYKSHCALDFEYPRHVEFSCWASAIVRHA